MATVTQTLSSKPLFLQAQSGDTAISYTATDMRNAIGASFGRQGVVGSGMRVQQSAAPGMSILVTTGVLSFGAGGDYGTRYILKTFTNIPITLTGFVTNPAATRTHRVWAAVYDKLISGTEYTSRFVVTEDLGSGAPAPTDASAYIELATITMAPGQTTVLNAQITNTASKAGPNSSTNPISLASGFSSGATANTSSAPRFQTLGSLVYLQGTVIRSTGNFEPGVSYTIATLLDGQRPKSNRYLIGTAWTAYFYRLTVAPTGTLTVTVPNIAGATVPGLEWISLDGLCFEMND